MKMLLISLNSQKIWENFKAIIQLCRKEIPIEMVFQLQNEPFNRYFVDSIVNVYNNFTGYKENHV